MTIKKSKFDTTNATYSRFDQLDGTHEWQNAVPEGRLLYKARKLKNGAIRYFNFNLAKEMGLIAKNHPHKMNKDLERKLLDTFCIRIINEFDIEHKKNFSNKEIKKHPYMATRYLQLQHKDKKGTTSGDGRCVWNGSFKFKGTTWDVSSRGTGVTALAPGAVISETPLESGNTDFGYGCGLAEIDELYSSAIMAEVMNKNGYNTERMLLIIETDKDIGIGVRAGKNLFRPAHLFNFLKQENYQALKKATDFYINRQHSNGDIAFSTKSSNKYRLLLENFCDNFANLAANLERDYIFAWLDWDGDNVLTNAGIIDYGSIRQFGLRHDQYRYDDVERFSTNLNEQKKKARLIVQVFAQMIHYLENKKKKPLADFKNSTVLKRFDRKFKEQLHRKFLHQMGLEKNLIEQSLGLKKTQDLYESFYKLEKLKTKNQMKKVGDGINKPAIFNAKKMLNVLPTYFDQHDLELMPAKSFYKEGLSQNHASRDSKLSKSFEKHIVDFQNKYLSFCKTVFGVDFIKKRMNNLASKSRARNEDNLITGNGLVYAVNELLESVEMGLRKQHIQKIIDTFIESPKHEDSIKISSKEAKNLISTMQELVNEYRESI